MTPSATHFLLISALCASSLVGCLVRDGPAQPWRAGDETTERLPPVELPPPSFALSHDGWGQWDGLGSPSCAEFDDWALPGPRAAGLHAPGALEEDGSELFPPLLDPGGRPAQGPEDGWSGRRARFRARACDWKRQIIGDHRNVYSWPTGRDFAVGLGLGAVLANTSLDQDFRDWYQRDVRSSGLDDVSSFSKVFGEGHIFIPACAGLALLDAFCGDLRVLGAAGDFGARASRAYLVGAPPMLLMQVVTGASRPGEAAHHSRWSPFDDNNGVSGHAFVGAVPFITAARMCENPWLKGGLYACSGLAAWSRVNDDSHYLSQAWLGWWMAYLACRAVDRTDSGEPHWTLVPLAGPQVMGVGLVFSR